MTDEMTESRWENARFAAVALMIGLVAGPYMSNFLGWQVTSGTALARERAGIVEQLASICDAQGAHRSAESGQARPDFPG